MTFKGGRGGRKGEPRALAPLPASSLIDSVLKLRGISDDIRRNRVLTEWDDLVGPRIAARTRPFSISDRALIIDVASSAWLQELNLLRTQLLNNLLGRIGEPRLFDDLKFKLAGRTGPKPEPSRARRSPEQKQRPVPSAPATGLAREQIVREVEAVDDLELRELIARVRIQNSR